MRRAGLVGAAPARQPIAGGAVAPLRSIRMDIESTDRHSAALEGCAVDAVGLEAREASDEVAGVGRTVGTALRQHREPRVLVESGHIINITPSYFGNQSRCCASARFTAVAAWEH